MPRIDAPTLLRSVGLLPDGPVVWGRPVPAGGPGVYAVELPAPAAAAPIDLARVGKWIERVPELRLDGRRPTSRELAARMGRYWLPDQVVLFVGASTGSVGGRIRALLETPPGDRRPYAGGAWLHVLRGLEACRIWWAGTDAPEETEDALLDAFAGSAGSDAGVELPEPGLVLPFAVLRRPTGERRSHGITGTTLPEAEGPQPAGAVRTLPPSEEPVAPRPTGGRTRPPGRLATPARAPTAARPRTPARPPVERAARKEPRARRPGAGESAPEPVVRRVEELHVSAEGLERMRAELDDLVRQRRPVVVRRVAAARELGDLSENAEYHAAREELGFIDGRVQALEDRLRRAVVIEAPSGAHAGLGSTVVVELDGQVEEIRLVGTSEADPRAGRISTSSPVGRALVGRVAGDDALVRTPSGAEIRYRVLEVR